MQTLTYTMGSDNRPLAADIQDFSIDFAEAGIKNWVQARQYESSMRQVFLNIKNEDGSPFDLTGANIWFEGLTPDDHRVIFDRQYVPIDPTAGQARIDFLAPAFAVAGSYKQSFFRIYRNGENISTLEFKFSVLADKVISGIVSSDYIQPFEAAYSDLLDIMKKADGDIKSQLATWTNQFTDLMTQLSKQGTDTSTMLTNLQTNIESLETQIKSDGLLKQSDLDNLISPYLTSFKANEKQIVNVYAMGAIADGQSHLISEKYATVEDAVKDYPDATSLTDELDWLALMKAKRYAETNNVDMFIPGGTYQLNKPFEMPKLVHVYGSGENTILRADAVLCAISNEDIVKADPEHQPTFKLSDLQINAQITPNTLSGLRLGGSRASKFNNLVIVNTQRHSVLVQPTNAASSDVENPTFEHVWSVGTGSFAFEANDAINRGNVTDAAVFDCQLTTQNDGNNQSTPAFEIIGHSNKYVYGIKLQRSFLQAMNNNLISIRGDEKYPSHTHHNSIEFVKGEMWSDSKGSATTGQVNIHIEHADQIDISEINQLADNGATQLELIDVVQSNFNDVGVPRGSDTTAKILTADAECNDIQLNIHGLQLIESATRTPNIFASDYLDLFANKFAISDEAMSIKIRGANITDYHEELTNETWLTSIANGDIASLASNLKQGFSYTRDGDTSMVHLKATTGTNSPRLLLPIPDIGKYASVFIRAKIEKTDDAVFIVAGSVAKEGICDGLWHDYAFIGENYSDSMRGVGFMINGVLKADLTISASNIQAFWSRDIQYIRPVTN